MELRLSVVIPVYNSSACLKQCLAALRDSTSDIHECIVVDDGSLDDSMAVAAAEQATVLTTGGRRGPAAARNIGARAATGDVLFFVDADVSVHTKTIARMLSRLASDPKVDAVIGSYDDRPTGRGFFSQYKNLQHHFVHQTASEDAATFWTGCGMIRRAVFEQMNGFSEAYNEPSIEDIELGYRMRSAGKRIVLDKRALATHHKEWQFGALVRTDILARGIPWTQLSLRYRYMPNDLNLRLSQRLCIAMVWLFLPTLATAVGLSSGALSFVAAAMVVAVLFLNSDFYGYLAERRGLWFSMRSAGMHLLYFFYCGLAFIDGYRRHWNAGRPAVTR